VNLAIDINVDLDLLRAQKATLVSLIDMADDEMDDLIVEHLNGLIHLLDDIQDQAAEVLDPGIVFGPLDDE